MRKRIVWLFGSVAVLVLASGAFAQKKAACPACSAAKVVTEAKTACPDCKAGVPCAACAAKKLSAAASKTACPDCKAGVPCAACAAKKVTALAKTTDGKKKPEEVKWLTDFAKAQKTAAKQKRNILLNFSGSDWCSWCIKLDGEVLSKKAFEDYARGRLVLVTADFPRRSPQDAKIKKQNSKLAEKYKIRGFPTVLLLNPAGKVLAQTGYKAGGPEVYVKHLTKLFEDAKKREEAAKKKALAQAKSAKSE